MPAWSRSSHERRNPRAEAAAHRIDEVAIVGLAEMVGVGIVDLASTETGEGQIGAVGTEVAAGNGIDIDEMADRGRAAQESHLRALEGDGDLHAERSEQRGGPGPVTRGIPRRLRRKWLAASITPIARATWVPT